MAGQYKSIFGIFADEIQAEQAVDRLVSAGFLNNNISVLLPDSHSTKRFAHEKHTKAPEGTAVGATAGGAIGTFVGLLAGAGAPLMLPGIGLIIAAGPIAGALAGLGAGGAVGGIIGALIGMGIPEYEAKRYEEGIKGGGVLLSVHCDTPEEAKAAEGVLEMSGAQGISVAGEAGAEWMIP